MKRDQKGFTIVELIIAVAILAIVTLAVSGFILVGSKSYTSANTDIMLQQDAQLALNQISDVIIDTTDSINYRVGTGAEEDESEFVLKDSEYDGEATYKSLVVVNRNNEGSNNNNECYRFDWDKGTETIYFNQVKVALTADMTVEKVQELVNDEFTANEGNKAILAQHVTELSIDLTQFEENRVVMIAMTFENGGRQYATSNNVTVRNRIAINAIEVDPMKIADEFLITNLSPVTLEPGDKYTFEANVETTMNEPDAEKLALEWTLVGSSEGSGTILIPASPKNDGKTAECTLQVGKRETSTNLSVRVTRLSGNEQYKGQSERVAVTVPVTIKRVNAVNISGAASAKQGETVELTGSAVGTTNLGMLCSADACQGDDLTADHDLIPSRWEVVSGKATIANPTKDGAEVIISADAAAGEDIVVRAYSQLSADKNGGYGIETQGWSAPIYGEWIIHVEQGIEWEAPLRGDFKLGTWDDPGPLDYMRSHLATDYGSYIFCVRVREKTATTAANDLVVLYHTVGANERFYPDLLGLTWDREYKVTFQVLDPVSKETREKKKNNEIWGLYPDSNEDIVNEYFAHINPVTGKYEGDKYPADDLYGGLLRPPTASFGYNGNTYPNNNKDYSEYYHLIGGGDSVMSKPYLGESTNIDKNAINTKLTFSVYKGEGSDPSSWETIYAYEEKDGHLGYTYTGQKTYGWLVVKPQEDPMLALSSKREDNDLAKTLGTYHIVPGFYYANNLNLGEDKNKLNFIYPVTGDGQLDTSKMGLDGKGGDYSPHYYPQMEATITLKIDMGMNLEMPPDNGEQRFTNFPVPTDFAFPFALKSKFVQTVTRSLTAYTKSGEAKQWYNNILVDCEYVPGVNGERDSYTIWLYTESNRNGASYTRNVIGKYTCAVGDEEWKTVNWNDTEEVKVETNIEYSKDYHKWVAYFPYPSKTDFPFSEAELELAGSTGVTKQVTLQVYDADANYAKKTENITVECQKSGEDYTITIKEEINAGTHKHIKRIYGKWTCSKNGKTWEPVGGAVYPQEEVKAIWGSCIFFTEGDVNKRMEFPLPGQAGFPSFTEDTYTVQENRQWFNEVSDPYGEDIYSYMYVQIDYTKASDGTYTVTLSNRYNSSLKYGTWTWAPGDTSWTKVEP